MIILGILLLVAGFVGILLLRKSSALKQVVATSQKLIDKNPEAFQELIDDKEVDHDESTKAQVKAVKKKINP